MAFTYNGLSQYIILTKSAYDKLATKSDQALYFISDTNEIYRGTVNYTSAIVVVNTLPNNPLTSKIYLKTSDNTLNIYHGSSWISFGSLNNSVSNTVAPNGSATSLAVSGVGIKNYVEDKLAVEACVDTNIINMHTYIQKPPTVSYSKNSHDYTCTFLEQATNDQTYEYPFALYIQCKFFKDGGTNPVATVNWAPQNYDEFYNSITKLTDFATDYIKNSL